MTGTDDLLAQLGIGDEYAEPYGDNVLLRPIEREKTTAAGLHLPSEAFCGAPRGLVLAVGAVLDPDKLEPGTQVVRPGDRILYDGGYETEVEVQGEKLILIPECAVEAIIRTKGV